jgi:hypothetical protein
MNLKRIINLQVVTDMSEQLPEGAVKEIVAEITADGAITPEEHKMLLKTIIADGVMDEIEARIARKLTATAINDAQTAVEKEEILQRWKATAPVAVFEDFMDEQNKKEIILSKHRTITTVLWIVSFLFLTLLSVLGISVP